jgi:hypothetical protein
MFVSKFVRGRTAIAALLAAAGLAACGEGPTTPGSPSSLEPTGPLLSKSDSPGRGKNVGKRTFTILPGVTSWEKFGEHVLVIPANTVCDPGKSKYGAAYWDAPCEPARRPIQVTATWGTVNGTPVISFSEELRFVPSNNEKDWVKLSLKDSKDVDPRLYYTILWYDRDAKVWVDESETDPTLKAKLNPSGNLVTRRLKHFSEYALWSGFGNYNVTSGLGGDSQ